jgi:hypothetical protein
LCHLHTGACDGTHDKTISKYFIPNDHWRAVFVEPVSFNVVDLARFLGSKGVADRSYVLKAAATSACGSPTIKIERPLYEEKNGTIPHWLRRQIGSVLPKHRDHARPEWTTEEVRCVTAKDVLTDWATNTTTSILAHAAAADISNPR